MYEQKTKVNDSSVTEFIEQFENPKKRKDAYRLLEIFSSETGLEAKMWGDRMIGFGSYHYKYASGHEGNAFVVGFALGKVKISLYLDLTDPQIDMLLNDFGKHTKGKSCVYVNKLSDIDENVLKKLIAFSLTSAKERYI